MILSQVLGINVFLSFQNLARWPFLHVSASTPSNILLRVLFPRILRHGFTLRSLSKSYQQTNQIFRFSRREEAMHLLPIAFLP